MGKAFYKGGFEPKMNKREAALILSLKSVAMNLGPHGTGAKADYRIEVNNKSQRRS